MTLKLSTTQKTAAWNKRQLIWKHNSFFGAASITKANMQRIIRSDTATTESKAIAEEIAILASQLGRSLKTRKDQDG